MLEREIVEREDSIQEIVCKPMSNLRVYELDKEKTVIMLALIRLGNNWEMKEGEESFITKLMKKRIEAVCSYTITDAALLVVALNIETPGQAVLYIWYLQYQSKKLKETHLTLDTICYKIFPNGFFSKEDLHTIWESQKIRANGMSSDNLVDYISAGESMLWC